MPSADRRHQLSCCDTGSSPALTTGDLHKLNHPSSHYWYDAVTTPGPLKKTF